MAQLESDLPRWILSSIIEYYKTNVVDPNSYTFLVDGVDVRDANFMDAPDRVELRVNGPDTHEVSAGCWRIWVAINLFFTNSIGQNSKNRYDHETMVGNFLRYTDVPAIPVHRRGNGPNDDGTLVGCLSPRRELSNAVRTVYFGQISVDEMLKQAQIDGRFEMYLE